MIIVAIVVKDESTPVEVQQWLDSNPTATINHISTHDNLVYVFYS